MRKEHKKKKNSSFQKKSDESNLRFKGLKYISDASGSRTAKTRGNSGIRG